MPDMEKVIKNLEEMLEESKYNDSVQYNPWADTETLEDAIALLKSHEQATIEPKRIDLADETKAWLDKMDAVDALENISSICMDWDGYRTANGLGGLINEIWAYARYCADRLEKAQEPKTCSECRHYDANAFTDMGGKCRNSRSCHYCYGCDKSFGCNAWEGR